MVSKNCVVCGRSFSTGATVARCPSCLENYNTVVKEGVVVEKPVVSLGEYYTTRCWSSELVYCGKCETKLLRCDSCNKRFEDGDRIVCWQEEGLHMCETCWKEEG